MDAAEAAPSFTAWARDSPSDEACVSMVVGSGAEQNGRWGGVEGGDKYLVYVTLR